MKMFGIKNELNEIKEILFEIRTVLEMQTDFVVERAEQNEANTIRWHQKQIEYLEGIRDARKKTEEEISEEMREDFIKYREEMGFN